MSPENSDTSGSVLPEPEYWYRYVDQVQQIPHSVGFNDVKHVGADIFGDNAITQLRFRVIKHTPCGVRLDVGYGERGKFVLRDSYKQWACPTIEKALESFIARKTRQAKIYRARLSVAENAIKIAMKEKSNYSTF